MRVEDTDVRCVFLKQTLHVSLPVLHIEPAEVKGSCATQSPWSYFMVLCRELSLFSNLTIRDASTFWTETNKPSSYLDWESNYVFLKITDHPTKLRNKYRTTFHTRMIESMKQMCCWVYSYVHSYVFGLTHMLCYLTGSSRMSTILVWATKGWNSTELIGTCPGHLRILYLARASRVIIVTDWVRACKILFCVLFWLYFIVIPQQKSNNYSTDNQISTLL